MKTLRSTTVLALCVTPVAGVALGFFSNALIYILLDENLSAPTDFIGWIGAVLFFVLASFFWGAMLGVPAMLVVGLALHAVLHRLGLRTLLWYAILGPIVGLVAYLLGATALQSLWPVGNPEAYFDANSIRGTLLIGLSMSVIFWLIRRPDRDLSANPPTPTP